MSVCFMFLCIGCVNVQKFYKKELSLTKKYCGITIQMYNGKPRFGHYRGFVSDFKNVQNIFSQSMNDKKYGALQKK